MRFGLAYYSTHVDSFSEYGSAFDVRVDDFRLEDIEVFADIRLPYGFHAGISSYRSIGNNNIRFEGLNYKYNDSDIRFRIGYEKRF